MGALPGAAAASSPPPDARPTTSSAAALVTIKFEAKVASIEDSQNVFRGTIREGDTISGFYRYDPSTPDSSESPNIGAYESTTKKAGITVNTKHFTFKTDPNNVNFLVEIADNNGDRDNYLLRSVNNLPLANGFPVDEIAWQLDDPTQTAVSSDALPTTAPRLADWQSIFGLTVRGEDQSTGNQFFIRAHVTKVS